MVDRSSPPCTWQGARCMPALTLLCSLLLLQARVGTAVMDVEARIRSDWQHLVRICPHRHFRSCETLDKANWTDAKRTRRLDMVQQAGRWLTFQIETFDQGGAKKSKGGDSWFIILRERQQNITLSTRVFDEGDGTYTVAAVIHHPGKYAVFARLWYSDCHGTQEPSQGDEQPLKEFSNILQKKDHCHIATRVRLKSVVIEQGSPLVQTCAVCEQARAAAAAALTPGSRILPPTLTRADYYTFRRQGQVQVVDCCKPRLFPTAPTTKRLFLCGDSTLRQQWNFLLWNARRPCKWQTPAEQHLPMEWPWWFEEMFDPKRCLPAPMSEVDPEMDQAYRRCTGGPSWGTVPIGTTEPGLLHSAPEAMLIDTKNYLFNTSYAAAAGEQVQREFAVGYRGECGLAINTATSFRQTVLQPLAAGDVLVLNTGPHPSRALSFWEFQEYMHMMGSELRRLKAQRPGVRILWRSSNIWKEYVFRNTTMHDGYIATGHFNTYLRGMMFDSYAEDVMLWAGIDIWDIYSMSVVGDSRPWDMIHLNAHSIRAINFDLIDQFACRS